MRFRYQPSSRFGKPKAKHMTIINLKHQIRCHEVMNCNVICSNLTECVCIHEPKSCDTNTQPMEEEYNIDQLYNNDCE